MRFRDAAVLLAIAPASAGAQACSYVEVRPGTVVGIEGKTRIGWEARGEPEVRVSPAAEAVDSGVVRVVVTKPGAPVYRADKVFFEKVLVTRRMALGDMFGRVMLATLFTAIAKNRKVDPWSRSQAAVAAVHCALVYDEREFIPVGSRVDPDKVLVDEDLVFVAEGEREWRGVPGAEVRFLVRPGQEAGVVRWTDASGRAAFDLRAAARSSPPGELVVSIRVRTGRGRTWHGEIRLDEVGVDRLRR